MVHNVAGRALRNHTTGQTQNKDLLWEKGAGVGTWRRCRGREKGETEKERKRGQLGTHGNRKREEEGGPGVSSGPLIHCQV